MPGGGAVVFGYYVDDPRPFGVVYFDSEGKAISIEEKLAYPKSNFIVPGLYFYDNQLVSIVQELQASKDREISITDVNNVYLQNDDLHVVLLEEQYSWFDAGTADSLYEASGAVKEARRRGKIIACLEETALHNRWITVEGLAKRAEEMKDTNGEYLQSIVDENSAN